MTDDRPPLAELLAKSGDEDFLRSLAESVLQIIMVGAERRDVEGLVGAGRHERSSDRTTWRNGSRDRTLETRLGPLSLKVPKLRTGSYFPGLILPWFGGRGQAAMRSIAAGERYPSAEWRRWVLYQPSIHPNRSRRASARVA